MISGGVPAGTSRPVRVSDSRSGTPASIAFGTSGMAGWRLAVSTASARNVPSLMLPIEGGSAVSAIGVWPAMVDVTAGAAPLKGTWTWSSLYLIFSNSPARCGVDPTPGPAKLYLPGLVRTNVTSSWTVFAGTCGFTTMTFGEAAISEIGAKSLIGSYGTLA